jgi:thiol-disulfide isomerase/thioredoxin
MATLENQNLHHVNSSDHFKELLSKDLKRVSLLYFWAPWAEPCKQMAEVVTELSRKYPKLLSLQIEAEAQEDITQSFDIESVPSFIILRVRSTHVSFGELTTLNSSTNAGPYSTRTHCRRRRPRPHRIHCEAAGPN